MDWSIFYIVLSLVFLAISTGVVGTSLFLQKKSLISDVMAHSVLPAIVSSILLFGVKDMFLFLLFGSVFSWGIQELMQVLKKHSKLKEDALMAVFLSFSFALGMLMLGVLEAQPTVEKAGLKSYLFGNVAGLLPSDLYFLGAWAVVVLLLFSLFYEHVIHNALNLSAERFRPHPRSIGFWLKIVTSITIILGIKSVGFILMGSFLISTVVFARTWTFHIPKMVILAVLVSVFSSLIGVLVSLKIDQMPTGPVIVLVITCFAFFSFLVSPKTILGQKWRNYRKNQLDIRSQNMLKQMYYSSGPNKLINWEELVKNVKLTKLKAVLLKWKLLRKKWVYTVAGSLYLSENGYEEGRKMVRKHRLWETYLASKLRMENDHIHFNAESIEHVLDEKTVKMLERELNYPTQDPHQSKIP